MKTKRPFEKIYIYLSGTETVKDGTAIAIFAMDDYSQYIFDPVIDKLTTNKEMAVVFPKLYNTIFENIFKDYNPNIHPSYINFVTNLPEETNEFIKSIIGEKHKIIYNDKETKKALMPFINSISKNKDLPRR